MSNLILVIEDNPNDQEMLRLFNDRLGAPLQLSFFNSGDDILSSKMPPPVPSLILMDWNMPGIAGQDLLVELRKRFPDSSLAVFTTAKKEFDTRSETEKIEDHYFEKPSKVTDFRELIRVFEDIAA